MRIYLDTSAISLLFQEDSPDRQGPTREFFRNVVASGNYSVFVSSIVVDEITRTPDEFRLAAMMGVIAMYSIASLPAAESNSEIVRLAEAYLARGLVPPNKVEDALHVAIATVHSIDVLVTWNYKHLAGIAREEAFRSANTALGHHHSPRIVTPLDLAHP